MAEIFLTGGSGFVGRRLVPALAARGHRILLLDRSGSLESRFGGALPAGASVVRGDLVQPETYASALAQAGVVVHLAASTGRASEHEHVRVNAGGTAALVDAWRRAGTERRLLVSTIAV